MPSELKMLLGVFVCGGVELHTAEDVSVRWCDRSQNTVQLENNEFEQPVHAQVRLFTYYVFLYTTNKTNDLKIVWILKCKFTGLFKKYKLKIRVFPYLVAKVSCSQVREIH